MPVKSIIALVQFLAEICSCLIYLSSYFQTSTSPPVNFDRIRLNVSLSRPSVMAADLERG